jgi:hypothetical protein
MLGKAADGLVDDSRERGRRPWTALDAAAASMARGASGVWLRAGSRLGLACRGAVYLLVGYLAFRLAVARAGEPASSAGAVQAAIAPAWGRILLVLLVAGLAAYAPGRFTWPATGGDPPGAPACSTQPQPAPCASRCKTVRYRRAV